MYHSVLCVQAVIKDSVDLDVSKHVIVHWDAIRTR